MMETGTSEVKRNVHSKRNNKKLGNPRATKRPKMVQAKLPKSASEVSSNWKALSTVLEMEKTSKGKKRKNREHQFIKSKKRKPTQNSVSKEEHSKNEKIAADIWFDDVDREDIEKVTGKKLNSSNINGTTQTNIISQQNNHDSELNQPPRLTKCLAMDCEFVGIGRNGDEHMLARVSLVNSDGDVLYDQFVAAQEKVIDYRTEVSGVRPSDLKNAPSFCDVQKDIASLIKNKTLVGHSIMTDLKVLLLDHPRKRVRDTAKYKPFQELMKTKRPSLKKLAQEVLSLSIQTGEHSSVEDARAAMQLYCEHRKEWEKRIKDKFKIHFKGKPQKETS